MSHRVRWWIPVTLLALGAILLAWVWGVLDTPRQDRVVKTTLILGGTTIALIAWALLFSGLPRGARLALLGVVITGAIAAPLLFDIRGYSGDLMPIVGLRFADRDRPADVTPTPMAEVPVDIPVGTSRSPAADPPQTWRDWPRFLGPDGDATLDDVQLERDLDAHPPRTAWRIPVGSGWSGFAVRGRDAVTQEQRGAAECVVCYDLETGAERWISSVDCRFESEVGGAGPLATPTITDRHVFAYGGTGILQCVDRITGTRRWARDVIAEAGARIPQWGAASSPLVVGDVVVVSAGGKPGQSVVAYDIESGTRRWSGGDDAAGYASPQLVRLLDTPFLVSFNHASVTGHDPSTGDVQWSFPWDNMAQNVAQPRVVADDTMLVSSGYGIGGALFRVTRQEDGGYGVSEVWKTRRLKAKFANFLVHEGFAYGLDDGIFTCISLGDGRRQWKGGRYGHGQVIRVGDTLLVTGEFGEVLLVEATPEEHRELARFEVLDEKTWNTPAFAAPYLLIRSDQRAVCTELPLRADGG